MGSSVVDLASKAALDAQAEADGKTIDEEEIEHGGVRRAQYMKCVRARNRCGG